MSLRFKMKSQNVVAEKKFTADAVKNKLAQWIYA
jgi:hypothetical protein